MDETCCRMGYMNNFARPYLAKAGFTDSTAAKFFSLVPANWESYYEEWKAASPYDISQYNGDNKVNPEKWITADTVEGLAERALDLLNHPDKTEGMRRAVERDFSTCAVEEAYQYIMRPTGA